MTAWPTVHSDAARAILARVQLQGHSPTQTPGTRLPKCPRCGLVWIHADPQRSSTLLIERDSVGIGAPAYTRYWYIVYPPGGDGARRCAGWRGFQWCDEVGLRVPQGPMYPNLEDPP